MPQSAWKTVRVSWESQELQKAKGNSCTFPGALGAGALCQPLPAEVAELGLSSETGAALYAERGLQKPASACGHRHALEAFFGQSQ